VPELFIDEKSKKKSGLTNAEGSVWHETEYIRSIKVERRRLVRNNGGPPPFVLPE